ncbi:MAG: hypothetical protein H6926_09205 [Chromatiales bacterium]|nr:hypothetical protein [Gammaproteobacteria bacterium]MCP5353345.1 hypothetical protein [Chromatiales bacterium]
MFAHLDIEAAWLLALVFLLGTYNGVLLNGHFIVWTTALIVVVPNIRILTRLFIDRAAQRGWRYLLTNDSMIAVAAVVHVLITLPEA